MTLGKFHPVQVPLWGDIARTCGLLMEALPRTDRPDVAQAVAHRWTHWRREKAQRATQKGDGLHPAAVFAALSEIVPEDAVIAVDVGNNAYSFGRYFETRRGQHVLMSGYLGSIGFGFPAAMGAWAATKTTRKVVAVTGDGGYGQYLAELTTAVRHAMPILHVLLDNGELGKISREQLGALRPVWQTGLTNPDFAEYARLCGAAGYTVTDPSDLAPRLTEALAVQDGPGLVHIRTDRRWV
jgi:thiamine pyrophosphate-dependent acetolactate synthase large subunit-like protein